MYGAKQIQANMNGTGLQVLAWLSFYLEGKFHLSWRESLRMRRLCLSPGWVLNRKMGIKQDIDLKLDTLFNKVAACADPWSVGAIITVTD